MRRTHYSRREQFTALCRNSWRTVHADVGAEGGDFECGADFVGRTRNDGARETCSKARSGSEGCGEADLPLEDGICGDSGTADFGVSEMDPGRTFADGGNCGPSRIAFSG